MDINRFVMHRELKISGHRGIGSMGDNLTIILNYHHQIESIKNFFETFMEQMPYFKGRFIIVTSDLNLANFNELESFSINLKGLVLEIINTKTDLGGVGNRNYALEYVVTDWIMFLENDSLIIKHNFLSNFNIFLNQASSKVVLLSKNELLVSKKLLFDFDMFDQSIIYWQDAINNLIYIVLSHGYSVDQFDLSHLNFASLNGSRCIKYFFQVDNINKSRLLQSNHNITFGKIKILVVIDVVDWAFANIVFNVVKKASSLFEFIVVPIGDTRSFDYDISRVMCLAKDVQIVHFMWRGNLFYLHNDLRYFLNLKNIDYDVFYLNILQNKIYSTCVYDHSLDPSGDKFIYDSFVNLVKTNYYVSSNVLRHNYEQIDGLPSPRAVCPDGVDLKLFKPCHLSRFNLKQLNENDRVIKIGWTGNSKWGENDHKGLHTIIKPAIERLQLDGYLVKLEIADRNIVKREQYDMPEFYNSIDIYACASLNEGTPNTVLESMACGIMVVTTDVGIVRDALGPKQQQYIANRTVDDFYIKLKILLDNKDQWSELSRENLEYIQSWDWPLKAQLIIDYFESLAVENDLL